MICENCGKEVSGPYCPNCGHPTGLYSNMKMEYDPDNVEHFISANETNTFKSTDEVKKTVVRRGDKFRQAEEEKKEQKLQSVQSEENSKEDKKAKDSKKKSKKEQEVVQPEDSDRWIIAPVDFFEEEKKSRFTSGAFGLFFIRLLVTLVSTITLGLAYPSMVCFYYKWVAANTEINGRKTYFDGNGLQLFGKYVLWVFLTVITLGIYSFWLVVKMKQWIVSHTHYVDEAGEDKKSEFTGGAFGLFFARLGAVLLTIVTLTIGFAWAKCRLERWKANHTVIDGYKQRFTGKGGSLFGKYVLWTLLTIITLGIYSFWYQANWKKWITANTQGINKESINLTI